MADPLVSWAVELDVTGFEALTVAMHGAVAAFKALDAPLQAFQSATTGAFDAARAAALKAAEAPEALLAIQKDLAGQLQHLKELYLSGAIAADEYGKRAKMATEGAAEAAKKVGEEAGKREVLEKKLAKEAKEAEDLRIEALKRSTDAYRTLSLAMAGGAGVLTMWVRAGMADTAEGEQMRVQIERLHREIANIFAPVIRGVVAVLTDLAARLRSMSPEMQAQIRYWVGIGAAALAVVVIVPRVVSGIMAISTALKVLAFSNPFTAILAVLATFMLSTEEGRDTLGELFEALKPAVEAITEIVGELAKAALPVVKVLADIVKTLVPAFAAVASAVATILRALKPLLDLVARLAEIAGGALKQAFEAIAPIIEKIAGFLDATVGNLGRLGKLGGEGASQMERNMAAFARWIPVVGMFVGQPGAATPTARPAPRTTRLTPRGGGMESVTAIWDRLQAALNRVDTPELREAQETNRILARIDARFARRGGAPLLPVWGPGVTT